MAGNDKLNEALEQAIMSKKSLDEARKCLEKGADPNHVVTKGAYQGSLLSIASTYSFQSYWENAGKLLIEFKANVNETAWDGKSLPMKAIKNGAYRFARYLIDHGSDMNYAIRNEKVFENGQTLLAMLEAEAPNDENKALIDYLKSKGASTGFVDW